MYLFWQRVTLKPQTLLKQHVLRLPARAEPSAGAGSNPGTCARRCPVGRCLGATGSCPRAAGAAGSQTRLRGGGDVCHSLEGWGWLLTPSPRGWRCRERCPCAHPGWRPWGWRLGLGDAPIDTFRCPTPNSTWARLVRRLGAAREEEMGCTGVTSALVLPRGPPWLRGPTRPPPGTVVWNPRAASPVASPVKLALCARWGFVLLPPEATYCPKTHGGGDQHPVQGTPWDLRGCSHAGVQDSCGLLCGLLCYPEAPEDQICP